MADFKTALAALAEGKINIDALAGQMEKLLQANPAYALGMLQQLDECHDQKKIDDKAYTTLKRQINQYRRTHAAETEGESAGGDATVFAQEDNFSKQAEEAAGQMAKQDSAAAIPGEEDVTAINESSAGLSEDETPTELKDTGTADQTLQPESGESPDSTRVMSDTEHSDAAARSTSEGGGETSDVDFDLHSTDTGSSPSVAGATGPTGTAWQQPAAPENYEPGHELGVGDIIKQRFKLLDVLGVGGMGKVFKGIDMLKEEAKDKTPYVAIKLLNEDFKSHPEAFISLQRESSRQQKLAHPNIATVYDFDRIGGPGTPVYITMELMEGQPLNTYIKKVVRKQGGLPFPEAFKIVKQLAAALEYAHARRLVHSDFKPGNAFLCNDGTVKTLDFGIARAVKNPVTGEAEKTLFDPGKLGALTPAYASLEMLEGQEPDTRDDTYALGCVAYELLTGKHPYNKLPATTARDNGLVPPYVKGLNKKSNRALRRAVAFKREDRSPTVEHFIEEFEGKPTWHKHPATIAAGILIIIGAIAFKPTMDYFNEKEIQGIIADISSGNKQTIVQQLAAIKQRPADEQTQIISDTGARDAIQNYYKNEIAPLISVTGDTFNFPKAQKIIDEVTKMYPDSGFVQDEQNLFDENKKQKIADLNKDYIAAIDVSKDTSKIGDTQKILATIRNRIDPNNPLLTDPRPANAYRTVAQNAFDNKDYQQALSYIDSGLKMAKNDARLTDLKNKVQDAVEAEKLNKSLEAVQPQLAALEDYQPYQKDIIRLSELQTQDQSPVLKSLADQFKKTVDAEIQRIDKDGTRAEAQTLVNNYEGLLSSLLLAKELTQLKLSHLSGDERNQAIADMINTDEKTIKDHIDQPNLDDPQWESTLLASVRELSELSNEDSSVVPNLNNYRETIAKLYAQDADATLQQQRFDAADALIARARKFAPDLALLQQTQTQIADAKSEYEKQQQIQGLKSNLTVQTDGNDTTEAQKTLDQLKELMDPNDPYLITTAPRMLAASYARLAKDSGDKGEYKDAMQLVDAGLKLQPRDPDLQALRDQYVVEVNIADLTDLFKIASSANFDETEVSKKVDEIRNNASRFAEFSKTAETELADRIKSLAATNEDEAAALADSASAIFPTSTVLANLRTQYQLKPWPDVSLAQTLLRDGKLSEATALEQKDAAEYSNHPNFIQFRQVLEARVKQVNEQYDNYLKEKEAAKDNYDKLRQASKLLTRIQSAWIDNKDFDKAYDDITAAIAAAPDNPTKKVIARESSKDLETTSAEALRAEAANWTPMPSGRECAPNLAGHGRRARAICYDLVKSGWRGPQMVVVPAEKGKAPFAIGKYEIKVSDYSKYCILTGVCKPILDKDKLNDPMTGISLEDAKKYAEWLSKRTGKKYRIPTKEEWEYAAKANGEQPSTKSSINCRLELQGKVIKGTGVTNVRDGESNGWGLYGYIGNAQEMVIDNSGGALAVGGAYSDMLSNCDISLQRPFSGSGDGTTGFRILEELGTPKGEGAG